MVNKILLAVTKQLGTTFGDTYHYYVENVEQNVMKPCFTVDVLIPIQRSKSAVLYERTMPMVIHYFTDKKESIKYDNYAKAEEVVKCLEYLQFENTLLRGEDISWQITDDVLQIFITYKFITIDGDIERIHMESLERTNFS